MGKYQTVLPFFQNLTYYNFKSLTIPFANGIFSLQYLDLFFEFAGEIHN